MTQIPVDIEKKLRAVIRRIEEAAIFGESFEGSTSVKSLAQLAGMSERSFRGWFKVYTGHKISHYVSKRRAQYASRIFRLFPDTSKADVSRHIGLSNPQALYPFMRKNGVDSIDNMRGTFKVDEVKSLRFRNDVLSECILFYTLKDAVYKECSTPEFEKDNWEEIDSFITSKFPCASIVGEVGFAIDRYIENKTEEGVFIAGILCSNVPRNQLSRDRIEDIGWLIVPGHKYAVFTHIGDYEGLTDTYLLCLETLRRNDIEIDKSRLIMERYLNSPVDTAAGNLKTELWVPINDN